MKALSLKTARNPSLKDIEEVRRIEAMHPDVQSDHPTAVKADHSKLTHINTYGELPRYYINTVFDCRDCGKTQIWRAEDQKWYYEEAKGHIDAKAVQCNACRKK